MLGKGKNTMDKNIQESRSEIFKKIEQENWDIIIVGGGITGAGILREAAHLNIKALLVEQRDFAWGTSSRSTKMIHGGLRYLKEGNVILTYKSVRERQNLLDELPGLVNDRSFVLPVYKGKLFQRFLIHIGLIIYNILAGRWKRNISTLKELAEIVPSIEKKNLQAGFLINDAVTDDARLVLRVISEATLEGSTAINYCRVTGLLKKDGHVNGVTLHDTESDKTFDVKSRLVINATGAWVDILRDEVKKTNSLKIRPLRGSHLIFSKDKIPLENNFLGMHPEDGRPVTILTWEGRVLVGTTDLDHPDNLNNEAAISQEEVVYLLKAVNFQFPELKITKDDIIATVAGIRPVVDTGKEDPSKESRDYVIWKEEGLLTVTGGKLTTFRITALDVLIEAQEYIGTLQNVQKKRKIFSQHYQTLSVQGSLGEKQTRRLRGRYGENYKEIISKAMDSELELIPGTYTLWAELRWAAQNESIVHLEDLMLRRTRLGLLLNNGGREIIPDIRKICQPILGWSDEKWQKESQVYLKLWKQCYSIPKF